MTTPYIGEIQLFGFDFAPSGWALCNGAVLPIAQNTALFSLLGTQFGGNGQTTFQLPNLVARIAVNQGHGPALSARSMGETFGENSVALQSAQIPSHNHALTLYQQTDGGKRSGTPSAGNALAAPIKVSPFAASAQPDAPFASSIGATGGSQAHENRQPFLAMNYCIALQGIFPSFQ